MELINLFIQYIYVPLFLLMYYLHTRYIKIDEKLSDYVDIKKDISYIKENLHYLLKTIEKD